MGKGSKQAVGFQYFLGMHFLCCHTINEIMEAQASKQTFWLGSKTANATVDIYKPSLFGGEKREGGLVGELDFMFGAPDQMGNSYLGYAQGLPHEVGYRGLFGVVAHGSTNTFGRSFNVGANNPYTKPWAFRVARSTAGWEGNAPWYPETALVVLSNGAKAMNPVHMLYESFTNSDWGMGYPASIIDDAFARSAALQCFNEGMGLCMRWARQSTIKDFQQEICDLAALVVRPNRLTGLTQIKAIRGGYDVSTLPHFTNDDVISFDNLDQTVVTGSTNEITGKYFDPVNRLGGSLTVQSLGSIQAEGVIVPGTRSFLALGSHDLCARVIERDLRGTSIPLRRLKAKFKPKAWGLAEGDLFVFSHPDEDIINDVFIVGEIDYGTPLDSGIPITAVEDIYQFPDASYVVSQPTGWIPPDKTPLPSPNTQGYEASYRDILAADIDPLSLDAGASYAAGAAAQPGALALHWDIWSAIVGNPITDSGRVGDFTPTGLIESNLGPFETTAVIVSGNQLYDVTTGVVAMLENERVRVDAINPDTGHIIIARGCEDTQAAPHPAGARIWFIEDGNGTDQVEYLSGEEVVLEALTTTTQGTLDETLAPHLLVNLQGRSERPYPPVLLTINSVRWDLVTGVHEGTVPFAWNTRNRIVEADQLVESTAASITPEAGTTYTLRVFDSTNTLVLQTTGITGTSSTFSLVAVYSEITVKLYSVRDGLECLQPAVATFAYISDDAGPVLTLSGHLANGTVGVPY